MNYKPTQAEIEAIRKIILDHEASALVSDDTGIWAMNAARAILFAVREKHGVVTVPVEPTDEMIDAGYAELNDGKEWGRQVSPADVYGKMIEAAEGVVREKRRPIESEPNVAEQIREELAYRRSVIDRYSGHNNPILNSLLSETATEIKRLETLLSRLSAPTEGHDDE